MNWTALLVAIIVFLGFGLALFKAARTRLPPLDLDWREKEARRNAVPPPRHRVVLIVSQYAALLLASGRAALDLRPLTVVFGVVFFATLIARQVVSVRHAARIRRAVQGRD